LNVLDQITPLIITYNEAPNIGRTLDRLRWASRVVVIDSGSTDGTVKMLERYPQVDVIDHPFTDFASQCNFGLSQVLTPWVLSLDADYELSEALVDELASLRPGDGIAGYRTRFVYRIGGRALRGSLYPPRTVLYRKSGASYRQEGHGHRVSVGGQVLPLREVIYHDDRKPLSRWVESQRRYARVEAEYLWSRSPQALTRIDRVRRMGWPAPLAIVFYALVIKGCMLSGRAGWYYALQRLIAEALIALEINDRRLRNCSTGLADDRR
jgi:glycosyltransferase involved in cell wall biosynthesis